MKIKKVLVTGGAGCIGYQVYKFLEEKKVKVVLFDVPEKIQKIKYKTIKIYEIF